MKLTRTAQLLVLCLSILSMLAQSVYALSAPCPDRSAPVSAAEAHHAMMMDHRNMGHDMSAHGMGTQTMSHDSMSHSATDNCCGDESCPMNACAAAAMLSGPGFRPTAATISSQETLYLSHYSSINPNLLVRPPISI